MNNPLERLDQVLDRARNLGEFLDQPPLIQAYFQSAAEFFGAERFPKTVFDTFLEQLRSLNKQTPEIGDRLWKTRAMFDSFSISVKAKTFGRRVSNPDWNRYVDEWIARLKTGQGALGSPDEVKNVDEVRAALIEAEKRIEVFESTIAALSKKKKHLRRVAFFREFRKQPVLRAAAACLLRVHLVTNPGRNVLLCGDADLLLNELERWRQHPEEVGRQYARADTRPIASLIRALIPKRRELLAELEIFPPLRYSTRRGKSVAVGGTSRGEFRFSPVTRPFHAIWRGLYLHECVSGCESDLKSNHPARWAIPALDGAMTVFVTSGSGYQGYVQFVPIRRNGARYLSLELQATALAKTIVVDPRRDAVSGTLFHHWFRKMNEYKSPEWEGFVVSESFDANEAGCSDCLHRSTEYVLGEPVGHARDFNVEDPLAEKIAGHFPRLGHAAHYPDGLIFDANLPDSGILRALFSGK